MAPNGHNDSTRVDRTSADRGWIELAEVSKSFRQDSIVSSVFAEFDLAIERGEFVCIVGKNGSGKTTLLNLLAGFLQPDYGNVRVAHAKVAGPGRDRAIVCHEDWLFPWLTLRGNIEFGLRSGVQPTERSARVDQVVRMMELTEALDRRPHEVSTGFRKRASIARALAVEPDLLLLDESFSSLDPDVRERVYDQILNWWSLRNPTILLATHSIPEAVRLATRVLVLAGRPTRVCRSFRPSGHPLGVSRLDTFRTDVDQLANICSEENLAL